MKQWTTLSLIVTYVVVFTGTIPVWAAQPQGMMPHHGQSEGMMSSDRKQSPIMKQESVSMRNLPAMLEQMAEKLRQGDVPPEMRHQMADQMQEMARRMQGMPGMMDSDGIMQPQMPMMDMHVMLDRMHDLQNQTHHMMGEWKMISQQPGMDTAYRNSMMNMSQDLNSMARNMSQLMSNMNAIMNNQALMEQNEQHRQNLEQMHTDLNGMMWNYERMVQRMQELQQQE